MGRAIIAAEREQAARSAGACIGFLSAPAPRGLQVGSGLERAMARALERQGNEVVWLRPAPAISGSLGRAFSFALRRLRGNAPVVGRLRPDWIIASRASRELAGLPNDVPVVYCGGGASDGERTEALAVRKAWLCAYPSRRAADAAIRNYGVDPSRVSVIPFGASMDVPERGTLAEKRIGDVLHLLFIGGDWEGDGGSLAVDALVRLQERGLNVTLVVAGCSPTVPLRSRALTVFPFLDARTGEGEPFFRELYRRSHLLLVPGPAPAFGALNEANGYGVPVIVAESRGPAEAVIEGVNGLRLPLWARGAEYAEAIATLFADPARYARLSHSSRETYERHGDWDAWAAELCRRMAETLPSLPAPRLLRA